MKSVNPYNNDLIAPYEPMTDKAVEAVIESVNESYIKWRETDFSQRGLLMEKAADILRNNQEKYAKLITLEMGKPIVEARAEIEKCAWVCEFYAKNAEGYLQPQQVNTDFKKSYVRFDPIGIVFAIMPWNFPFWQVFRFAAPTLMAGNVGVLKHASNVSGCAIAIEEVFKDAGFDENVFRTLIIDHSQAADVIANKHVRAVTLTGSVVAGKSVAKRAGQFAKKTVLELGGSDAYIILADADVEKASELCVKSRMINGGQSCIAAKRFIVHESIYDVFVQKLKEKMQAYVMGDPLDEDTQLGPLVNVAQRDDVHRKVLESVDSGARCVLGGEVGDREDAFYPPTVLIDVKEGMPAYNDEIFAPVASVIKFSEVDEAVKIANDSVFGLGGAVFSADIELAQKIAAKMDTGNVAINDFVKSDPRLPFGGVKYSGYGRELAEFGIREFVNIKAVVVS